MKNKTIRWTVEAAAREFARSRTTVCNRLAAAGIAAAEDGTFSTKQICDALFGSSHEAKLREANARADLANARTEILHKKWLPADLVEKVWTDVVVMVSQRLSTVPEAVASRVKSNTPRSDLVEICRAEISSAREELSKGAHPEIFSETKNQKMDNENQQED